MKILIDGYNAIKLCARTLRCNDIRLIDHGTRVAYFASKIAKKLSNIELDSQNIYLLSLFHDIGAYKTEEIDSMVKFETVNIYEHSAYGHLFLKHLSPLSALSEAILYHHFNYADIPDDTDVVVAEYAKLLHIADRIDVGYITGMTFEKISYLIEKSNSFTKEYIEAALQVLKEDAETLNDRLDAFLDSMLSTLTLNTKQAEEFLLMMIYSIDFKSPATMLHSVNTTSVSIYIGEKMGLDDRSLSQIYTAALIHDIGKITTPTSILEYNGRLNDVQMEIMREHVSETRNILYDVIDSDTVDIAVNHHEKLDGTGYPRGLKAEELSISSRIVAVADIASALLGRRSYKDHYSWEKTLSIFKDMVEGGKLDAGIVAVVEDNYKEIEEFLKERATPVTDKYNLIFDEFDKMVKNKLTEG